MHPARAFLFSLEQIGIKLGLEQIRGLLAALGHPDRAYPSIIIAGTNGKGSTTAMVERGLRAAGRVTGRYTSPHLVTIEERFAINGRPLEPERFNLAAARIASAAMHLPAPPSFFEATTALALDEFRAAGIDVAVLEVGLGGRLDATNAVDAIAAAITAIDLDHQQFLGHTIEAIAAEKAAVIKAGSLAVIGENPAAVEAVVAEQCRSVGADLVRAWQDTTCSVSMHGGRARLSLATPTRTYAPMTLNLAGRHQVQNALTAVRLLEALDARGQFVVPEAAIRQAVEEVEWPGRLELGRVDGHDVLIDGAHNPAGARALAAHVRDTYGRKLPVVFGAMHDKDVDGLVTALAPVASHVTCTPVSSSRAASAVALAEAFARLAPHVPVSVATDPLNAIRDAAGHGTPVVVAGSLYLAGEIRSYLS